MSWFEACFFLTQFPYVSGDSQLVIRAFHHLHTVKHPHWVDFITEKGNIERFYDLFIGHLTIPKDEMMDPPIELNLFVCGLLLDLVLGNKGLQMRVERSMHSCRAVRWGIRISECLFEWRESAVRFLRANSIEF
jgi:hypothetical protein